MYSPRKYSFHCRINGCYLLELIAVFIPTLPNHGSIYANSINGIIANPFQTYTEQCPNGTAGYFSLNYLALRNQQPIPKLGITKYFIWPTRQINKNTCKTCSNWQKNSDSQFQNWLKDTVIEFFPPTNYGFVLLYPYEIYLISKRCFLESIYQSRQSFTKCNKLLP